MTQIVAFQGEPGAYSQQACRQYFGDDVVTLPCPSFPATFDAVRTGNATHIMLPVENSLAGSVSTAADELIDSDLRVQGEEVVRVRHCLLAPRGTELSSITQVKSHWQALAQCTATLRRMNMTPLRSLDTAGAARELSETLEPHTAALASSLAAELYGLDILARDLQDKANNYTRFSVLGRGDVPRGDFNKTSLLFTTRDDGRPGALVRVLQVFSDNGINITKIESRPRPNVAWHYRFFVDIEGHEDDPNVSKALSTVLRHSSMVKILGSYPAKRINGS